ncbi:MAG: bifunctional nuclease family protein [Anaerolineae bacterium]|jgi:bifunctional DNase/RNase|nr:bifunctional nuclease family protein [Anaerolineae bacterium]MDH7473221.1 bifunctional nuclease family protein [Anaerolineae bacterium]
MIEVTVDSVRVSLLSQHRVVILKDVNEERYLPIWIGPFEADAITIQLQGIEVARPQTHDLLKSVFDVVGARIHHIIVNDLREDTFYARIVVDSNGRRLEIDARPSDAIALAVRAGTPIFVDEAVMERAAITPEEDEAKEEEEDRLSVFRDFVDSLDLGELGEE